ncbi:MAG: CopD family protein [Acidimicrobiia bacterium]|nr:CopD family protein [Acidimicrobiia bacterium]
MSGGALRRRAARALLWASWGVLVVATGLSIGLQGVAASAGEASGPTSSTPRPVCSVLDTRFGTLGHARVARRAGGASFRWSSFLALPRHRDRAAPRRWPSAVVASCGGRRCSPPRLDPTVAFAGHAGSGRLVPLALAIDVGHLAAMSLWVGGLVVLATVLLPWADDDELSRVVPRFSSAAFGCVVVLVATGSVQSWRQVGSLDALTGTTYGQVLLAKLVLVAGIVAVAALSRTVVRRHWIAGSVQPVPAGPGAQRASGTTPEGTRLRRSVGFEVVLGAAVLLATAVLVNLQPAVEAVDAPYATQLDAEELTVDFVVDPARSGPLDVHVYTLGEAGMPVEVDDVFVDLHLAGGRRSPHGAHGAGRARPLRRPGVRRPHRRRLDGRDPCPALGVRGLPDRGDRAHRLIRSAVSSWSHSGRGSRGRWSEGGGIPVAGVRTRREVIRVSEQNGPESGLSLAEVDPRGLEAAYECLLAVGRARRLGEIVHALERGVVALGGYLVAPEDDDDPGAVDQLLPVDVSLGIGPPRLVHPADEVSRPPSRTLPARPRPVGAARRGAGTRA